MKEMRQTIWPIIRGTLIGGALGILPGNGAVLGSFASYTVEKKMARDPSRFGRGAIEGVAGPESANNAGAQTSFIPLLTLGIPPNAVMAIMVGAMTIHGIIPGPQVINSNPDLFWGLITSMWIGNLMLLIINLPLIGIWVRLLKVPYRLALPGDHRCSAASACTRLNGSVVGHRHHGDLRLDRLLHEQGRFRAGADDSRRGARAHDGRGAAASR